MSHLDLHTAITRQLVRLFSECRFAPQPILPAPATTPNATTAAELLPVTAPVPVPVVTTATRSTCTDQSASTERPFKMHQRSVVPQLMAPPPQVVVMPPLQVVVRPLPQVVVMIPPPALLSQQPGVMLLPAEPQPQPAVPLQ
ncbi:uncharacterized protein LOC134191796 [Corticium candelabrum]|uniref:uncharacterized protein LOC134191796 n=1 Tax=Corticium candelabrum TaxID=121492 RepID=UPI002E2731A5|nr:uncharacterized protein LOC134191796 [Corticium candelabrum]